METIEYLQQKRKLEASDAAALLQLIQEQATPILSLRAASASSLVVPEKKQVRTSPPSRSSLNKGRVEHASNHSSKKRTQLNINSLEEFPPMDSGTSNSKKKGSKLMRRITLTPVGSQAPVAPQFSSTPSANVWKSNPAFTRSSYSSFEGPQSLTEERKLLQQEREKSKRGNKSHSRPSSNRSKELVGDSQHYPCSVPSVNSSDGSGRNSPSSVPKFCSGNKSYISDTSSKHCDRFSNRGFTDEGSLDAKISSHSIFELSGNARNTSSRPTKTNPKRIETSSPHTHSKKEQTPPPRIDISTVVSQDDEQSASLISSSSRSTLPMTSTPLLDMNQPLVSPDSVTNQVSLDGLAKLYAVLINDRLVPNLTSEIHFILQMLTATIPPTASTSELTGSHDLFVSIENCVYFAASVLNKIKHILVALDKATLQLLSENVRIAEFKLQLATFFSEACEKKTESCSPHSSSLSLSQDGRQTSASVPFQEETDNSKNFPNQKAFHVFKKQRDAFYSVLREWEKERDSPDWKMEEALTKRVQFVIKSPTDLTSHAHFARLFQRQLVESCRCPMYAEKDVGRLVGQLGKTDPQRLMKLNERFFLPPSTGYGPCPPPSFSPTEEFFTTLIKMADSYTFNQHLKIALYAELNKLHLSCSSVRPLDIPDVVHTMRLLAKFLGFLEFLPHTNPSPDSVLSAREMLHSFDIHQCVLEAQEKGHLYLTIPWVVELLSVMDAQAVKLKQYSQLLATLINIYREVQLSVVDGVTNDHFLILTCLGWLFENPSISSSVFFDHLKNCPDGISIAVETSEDMVTTELLYACCPFLGELRSMLSEFAAGLQTKASPIRKIKPISVTIEGKDDNKSSVNPLQVQLQENFFRNHPPYLKQLCQIAADRSVANALGHCEQSIVPQNVLVGARTLATWMGEKWSDTSAVGKPDTLDVIEPFSRLEADRQLVHAVDDAVQSVTANSKIFCLENCKTHATRSLGALLVGSVSDRVIATASGVVATWALEKCTKWISEKPHVLVREQLSRSFDKMLKAVKMAKRKEECTNPTHLQSSRQARNSDIRTVSGSCLGASGGSLLIERDKLVLPSPAASMESEAWQGCSITSQLDMTDGFEREQRCAFSRAAILSILSREKDVLEEFKRIAQDIIKCTSTSEEKVLQLKGVLGQLTDAIDSGTSILPGVRVPQLLPHGCDEALTLSIKLATVLVAQAVLKTQDGVSGELLNRILSFWKLAKGLKMEVCVHRLLSATAFDCYCKANETGHHHKEVWKSLSDVLVGVIEVDVVSSPVIEGLWLCRKQQLNHTNVLHLLTAASVFLTKWYTVTEKPSTTCTRESHFTSEEIEKADSIDSAATAANAKEEPSSCTIAGTTSTSAVGQGAIVREVHFARLLSVVFQELQHTEIPQELLTHQDLSEVMKIVHPF